MPASRKDTGSALILALWATAAAALAAASIIAMGRVQQSVARNSLQLLEDQVARESGIQIVAHGLLVQSVHWKLGVPHEVTIGKSRIRILVTDEAGKVDLNAATDEILMLALVPARLDEARRHRIVDALQDWRDADDERRLHGAEKADYTEAGYQYAPRNRFFANIAEFQRVMGVTSDVYRSVEAGLTVYSQRASVDTRVASPAVLRLLPRMDEAAIASAMRTRQSGDEVPLDTFGRTFSIQAEILERPEAGRWIAVMYLTGRKENPILVKSWQAGENVKP
jgi:general secretion pathway protein K